MQQKSEEKNNIKIKSEDCRQKILVHLFHVAQFVNSWGKERESRRLVQQNEPQINQVRRSLLQLMTELFHWLRNIIFDWEKFNLGYYDLDLDLVGVSYKLFDKRNEMIGIINHFRVETYHASWNIYHVFPKKKKINILTLLYPCRQEMRMSSHISIYKLIDFHVETMNINFYCQYIRIFFKLLI